MPDLLLDYDAHDLLIEGGDFKVTTSEADSLKQRLIVKLYTYLGEFYLDTTIGIPYYQRIFKKGTAKATIDSIFLQAILSEPEVIQVESFESSVDRASRIYSLSFRVRSSNESESIPIEIEL